jgi:hypothetical protein
MKPALINWWPPTLRQGFTRTGIFLPGGDLVLGIIEELEEDTFFEKLNVSQSTLERAHPLRHDSVPWTKKGEEVDWL